MKLTKEEIKEIAIKSETYEEFREFLGEIVKPYRSIREGKPKEYVKIESDTYGTKTAYKYTNPADEGTIIKINLKTVTVRVPLYDKEKENMKYPPTALISSDLSDLWDIIKEYESFENYYYKIKK